MAIAIDIRGQTGSALPPGGSTGQILTKASNDDLDTAWETPSGGGGLSSIGLDNVSSSINRYFTSQARSMAASNQAITALQVCYVPFLVLGSVTAQNLGINVTTGAASAVARCGIYSASNGYMNSLLGMTGDIDVSTTGFKTASLGASVALTPGWYFMAFVCSIGVTISGHTSNASNLIGGNPFGFATSAPTTPIDFRFETVASAVLPATAASSTTARNVGVQHAPMVFVGV